MEADEEGVTAKNTYGGPLLLRTEFESDGAETTYQYLYNAHGDVVTLISDEAVVATYYYDSFGNILEQTGEVSNSTLYAGYQYDEETGLYYINARMYDPVTARFLQADTYAGNVCDPLSLNLYTYCLNNPHKYVDPSGHFVLTAAAALLIARIGISLVAGIVSAKSEYDRQIAEGDNYTNWGSVLFVGAANAGISFFTFGLGQGAAAVAGAGAKAVLKQVGKAVIRDAAIGALTDAGVETARQLVTGTKITNLEYDRIAEAGVYGGIAGGGSTLAGAGLESLMKTRAVQSALTKVNLAANKGADGIKKAFKDLAMDNSGKVDLDVFQKGGVLGLMSKTSLKITNKFADEVIPLDGRILDYYIDNGRIKGIEGIKNVDFVITTDSKLVIGNKHHYLGNRQSVLAAGQLKINGKGKIKRIDNLSGHYRPTVNEAMRYQTLFEKQGLDLNKTWLEYYRMDIDADGMVVGTKLDYVKMLGGK